MIAGWTAASAAHAAGTALKVTLIVAAGVPVLIALVYCLLLLNAGVVMIYSKHEQRRDAAERQFGALWPPTPLLFRGAVPVSGPRATARSARKPPAPPKA